MQKEKKEERKEKLKDEPLFRLIIKWYIHYLVV